MTQPLKFEDLIYDPRTVCWGGGNNLVGPKLLARIQLRKPTKKEDMEAKADYERTKEIFYKHVRKGARFKPNGDGANKAIECKITYVNTEKQTITWRQDNINSHPNFIGKDYKPAVGKWSINAFLSMIKSGRITPIEEQ